MKKTKKRRKQGKRELVRGLKDIKKRVRTEGYEIPPMPRRKTIRKACSDLTEFFTIRIQIKNKERGDKDE